MSTLELKLPDSLQQFLESQAAAGGFASPNDFVIAVLRALERRQAWDGLEALVLEGLGTPAREMSAADWQSLRDEIDRLEGARPS